MDEEPQGHGHLASMDLDGKAMRQQSMIISGAFGVVVAVVTFGLLGWAQRKTFNNTTVSFKDATRVTVIEEEK